MDKEAIRQLEKKLEEKKNSLQKELEKFATEDKDQKYNWDTKYPNREDSTKEEEADETQEYDNLLSLEHSLEVKLRDVEIALEKITKGNYGSCSNCSKPIEEQRLRAFPEAKLCIECNKKAGN